MAWIAFGAPESPHYLLEKFDYVNLKLCLQKLARINNYNSEDIDNIIEKLKINAEKELE
jgi:hypothetical protein